MQQTGYHHANMLAAQLCTDLNNQGNDMLAMVQELILHDNPGQISEGIPPEPAANDVVQDNVQLQMLRII